MRGDMSPSVTVQPLSKGYRMHQPVKSNPRAFQLLQQTLSAIQDTPPQVDECDRVAVLRSFLIHLQVASACGHEAEARRLRLVQHGQHVSAQPRRF